jgi:hypothetical protein
MRSTSSLPRFTTLALAGLLLSGLAGRALAEAPTSFVVLRKLGEGGNQKAYRVSHGDPALAHLKVLKIIKGEGIGRGVRHANAALRHTFAREAVETAALLRASPQVQQRFGDVLVPSLLLVDEIRVVKPSGTLIVPAQSGAVLQGKGAGVSYASLPPALRLVAEREVNAFADLAERVVPTSPVTGRPLLYSRNFRGNYLYDAATGKIASTFDHISDAQRTH